MYVVGRKGLIACTIFCVNKTQVVDRFARVDGGGLCRFLMNFDREEIPILGVEWVEEASKQTCVLGGYWTRRFVIVCHTFHSPLSHTVNDVRLEKQLQSCKPAPNAVAYQRHVQPE